MPGSVPSTLYTVIHLILQQPYEVDSVTVPFLQVRNLNLVKGAQLVAELGFKPRQPDARDPHFTTEERACVCACTHTRNVSGMR